jgi:hypothetical protein
MPLFCGEELFHYRSRGLILAYLIRPVLTVLRPQTGPNEFFDPSGHCSNAAKTILTHA